MRSGRNPTRRNRNIGTVKQGHGQDNRDVIPAGFPDDRIFYEHLVNPVAVRRTIGDHNLTFLVEPTRSDCTHACTIDDVCHILQFVSQDHLDGIELVLLRQPTRKQSTLSSVWGRFVYYAVTGKYSGTAICLEAQDISKPWHWKTSSASPDDHKELDRLREDGHRIALKKRFYEIERTLESVRSTQLYRTLLHELGHYVDWLIHLLNPVVASSDPDEEDRITRAFDGKPFQEREAFAHRYADDLKAGLTSKQSVPFERILDYKRMEREGLNRKWFTHNAG